LVAAVNPYESSTRRAWAAVVLGIAGVLTMPAAVAVARESKRFALLDASFAVPLAFLLGILSVGMASRARRNLAWLRLDGSTPKAASAGVILGVLAVSLALMAALSVGFYEAVIYYQHHH
jgi:hypothetical protein